MPYSLAYEASYDPHYEVYDMSVPPEITRTGQRLFDLLPDYVRDADSKDELLRYLAAIGDAAGPVAQWIDDADPDTSTSGTSEPVNPATTPATWLGWLGWLLGSPIIDLTVSQARWYLSRAGVQAHGSPDGMRAAIQATLTGDRFVAVDTCVGGDPWAITVTVDSTQVVDTGVTLRAAAREKPAGANLTVTPTAPATWNDLATAYTTWAGVAATGKTCDELRFG